MDLQIRFKYDAPWPSAPVPPPSPTILMSAS